MSRALQGRLLRLLGGLLLVAGFAWPELGVLVGRLFGGDAPLPMRSHWFVLHENLDMVREPDDSLPGWYTVWYAVQVLGLAWFGAAGFAIAAAALLRSRLGAVGLASFHGLAWLLLALGVAWVFAHLPPPREGQQPLIGVGAVVGVSALAVLQAAATWRALRIGGWWRLGAVDFAQIVPLLVLFLANAGCWIGLRGHPNWPAGGYAVGAVGGWFALAGVARSSGKR